VGALCEKVRSLLHTLRTADSVFNAVALGDPDELSTRLLAHGEDADDVAAVEMEVRELQAIADERPGLKLIYAFLHAETPDHEAVEEVELARSHEPTPRWPSTLDALDDPENGGLYGLVIEGGSSGVGKTALAIASAVRFARECGKVIYINAELARSQVSIRLHRACEGIGVKSRELIGKGKRFRLLDVSGARSLSPIFERCVELIDETDPRVLVVVDTMNRIATELQIFSGSGDTFYWSTLSRLQAWCLAIRRKSEGLVSFILISELNRKGETKGAPDPIADMVLNLTAGDGKDCVVIEVTKGREGGRGPLGAFLHDWKKGRVIRSPGGA